MNNHKMENQYGQEQKLLGKEYVKIQDKYLEVRLIQTRKFRQKGWTSPMPRAKFISEWEYLKMKKESSKGVYVIGFENLTIKKLQAHKKNN